MRKKLQPPLSKRLAEFQIAKQRTYRRYIGAMGATQAMVDMLRNMNLEATEEQQRQHLKEMAEVMERCYATHKDLADKHKDIPDLCAYHRGASIEFMRLATETHNLLNPLPEDML
jgi:hypothetical protein